MTTQFPTSTTAQPVVLISGASQGLGYALAKALLSEGFAVALFSRRPVQLDKALHQLQDLGPLFGRSGDVTDPSFVASFIGQIVERFGRIDCVVNNASTLGDLPLPNFSEITPDNLRRVFETNTLAPVKLIQSALPYLSTRPISLAIGISSDAAVAGYPGWGAYGASKAAFDLLSKTLAQEERSQRLSAYAVDPGDMDTEMHEAALPGETGLASPESVASAMMPLFRPLLAKPGSRLLTPGRWQVSQAALHLREEW